MAGRGKNSWKPGELGNAYVSPLETPRSDRESFSTNTSDDRMSVGGGKLRHMASHREVSLEDSSEPASETARRMFVPKFSFRTFLYQFFSHLLFIWFCSFLLVLALQLNRTLLCLR